MWGWFGRAARARSFGLKYWILSLLSQREMTGAEIIDSITAASMGFWRPSPGSVYPALKELTDEGMIEYRELGNRKLYRITEKGRNELVGVPEPSPLGKMSGPVEAVETLSYYVEYLMEEKSELDRNPALKKKLLEVREKLDQLLR